MRLEIFRLAPDDLDEPLELRLDLDDRLVEVDEIDALLVLGAVFTAAFELPVRLKEARDERRVGAGLSQADIGMLTHRDIAVGDKAPALCASGMFGITPTERTRPSRTLRSMPRSTA